MVRHSPLPLALGVSALLHAAAIPVVSKVMSDSLRETPPIRVNLITVPAPVEEKPKPVAAPPPPPPKVEPKPVKPPAKIETKAAEPARAEPVPQPPPEEPTKKTEPEKSVASNALPGGGGPNTPEIGTPGRGGGASIFAPDGGVATAPGPGLGRSGSGTGGGPPGPGTAPRGASRPGTPIQTAKASYPPMALRMGLEADVPLKVYVDENGRVLKVEVTKSAGMGFDEEAVKTVKQYRFEPAMSDGKPVPTEFSYVYRFRLK
jgi:periplasmic protein TonB